MTNCIVVDYYEQLNAGLAENLYDIIENETYIKFDQDLTKSDINPKDRQNYSSCLILISSDIFEIQNDGVNTREILICLQMLKIIIAA